MLYPWLDYKGLTYFSKKLRDKLKTAFNDVYKKLTNNSNSIETINSSIGSTNISSIGDGTLTGAVSELDSLKSTKNELYDNYRRWNMLSNTYNNDQLADLDFEASNATFDSLFLDNDYSVPVVNGIRITNNASDEAYIIWGNEKNDIQLQANQTFTISFYIRASSENANAEIRVYDRESEENIFSLSFSATNTEWKRYSLSFVSPSKDCNDAVVKLGISGTGSIDYCAPALMDDRINSIIGNYDIGAIGDGTVTGAIGSLNSALTNGSVTKVGTSSVGSGTHPIYLSSGTPTESSSTVGSSYRPVYMNAGALTQCAAALFYTAGDTFNIMYYGAGYVTSSGSTVHFTIAVAREFSGISSLSVTSKGSATIRQNNSYCYGSSADSGVTPSSITVSSYGSGTGLLHMTMTFSNTTNITNNSAVGIALSSTTISCS